MSKRTNEEIGRVYARQRELLSQAEFKGFLRGKEDERAMYDPILRKQLHEWEFLYLTVLLFIKSRKVTDDNNKDY